MAEQNLNDLKIAGVGTSSGGTYRDVTVAGVGTVEGPLTCASLTVNGLGTMQGDVKAGTPRSPSTVPPP